VVSSGIQFVMTVQSEFHGKELFHGKGTAKGRKLAERVQIRLSVGTNDQTAAQMIHTDGVHILTDLSGHTMH